MNNLYPIWVHGHDGWKWSEDCQCYLYRNKDNVFSPPDDYCLGDRMIWNMTQKKPGLNIIKQLINIKEFNYGKGI